MCREETKHMKIANVEKHKCHTVVVIIQTIVIQYFIITVLKNIELIPVNAQMKLHFVGYFFFFLK